MWYSPEVIFSVMGPPPVSKRGCALATLASQSQACGRSRAKAKLAAKPNGALAAASSANCAKLLGRRASGTSALFHRKISGSAEMV